MEEIIIKTLLAEGMNSVLLVSLIVMYLVIKNLLKREAELRKKLEEYEEKDKRHIAILDRLGEKTERLVQLFYEQYSSLNEATIQNLELLNELYKRVHPKDKDS